VRAFILAIVAVAAVAQPASPQPHAPAGGATFLVNSISPFAGPKIPLALSVTVINPATTPLTDASVRLTVHNRVITRTELQQALDGSPKGEVLGVTTEQLGDPLAPGLRRSITITSDLASLSNTFASPSADGVYPVTIGLHAGGDAIEESTTAIPFFFAPPESRLNITIVVPIHRAAAFDASGAYPAGAFAQDVSSKGAFGAAIAQIVKHQTAGLTLAPDGLTLDQIGDLTQGYTIRDASGTHDIRASDPSAARARETLGMLAHIANVPSFELATVPYSAADLVGLAAHHMESDVSRQLTLGSAREAALLNHPPNPRVVIPGGYALDARSAVLVASTTQSPIVVISPESLPERQTRFGYDRPETVTGGAGVNLIALVVDAAIRDRIGAAQQGPVLSAQGVIAETAASYFELPALAPERLIVVAPPSMPDPDTLSRMLDGLGAAPWVQVRTASDAAGSLPPNDQPIPLPISAVPDRAPLIAARAATKTLSVLSRVLGEQQRPVALLDRFLLAAEAADYTTDPTRGEILARAARGSAERTLGLIRVPARQVTLTSHHAQVPVTLLNDTGLPVHVQVRLVSAKIGFPSGNSIDLDATQRVTTFTFRAETRVAGSFPLHVQIRTPDGKDLVGEGDLIVRSTAVSGVTLAVTGGGVAVLLGSWFRRLRRERKQTG